MSYHTAGLPDAPPGAESAAPLRRYESAKAREQCGNVLLWLDGVLCLMLEGIQDGHHYVIDSILADKGYSVWRWTVRSVGREGRIVASSTSASEDDARSDALGAISRAPL